MDDLISRQAAIDEILGQPPEPHYPSWYAEQIKQLPPAQPKELDTLIKALEAEHEKLVEMQRALPKQRTGRWERHYSRPNVYADLFWHCSECGYKNNDDYAPTYHKFCPNCGIKMIQTDKTCDCYSNGRCVGTKEIDSCSCGGNKSKCDFYENVRREGDAE